MGFQRNEVGGRVKKPDRNLKEKRGKAVRATIENSQNVFFIKGNKEGVAEGEW